jgi:hypothetical protein
MQENILLYGMTCMQHVYVYNLQSLLIKITVHVRTVIYMILFHSLMGIINTINSN